MRAVSRASRTPCRTDGESASEHKISSRLLKDFDPGSVMVALIAPLATGAAQLVMGPVFHLRLTIYTCAVVMS